MIELSAQRIHELLRLAREKGASDLHCCPGMDVMLRVDGQLEAVADSVTSAAELEDFVTLMLGERGGNRLGERGDADSSYHAPNLGSFRVHASQSARGIAIAIRLLAQTIPTLDALRLPPIIGTFAERHSGLVLFAGPTGSGKTTAVSSLIDCINRTEHRHILTIEDPIEYEQTSLRSLVTQREVHRDVGSFSEALRGALRADPDVLLVGEMRDQATMAAALVAAETGHLVLATLHTGDAAQTIDRIIDSFPTEAQGQVRLQIAQSLAAVVCLRLVPRRSSRGRRAAAEILIATDAVRNLIRDGKTHQLRNVILTNRQRGMQTLEMHLSDLVARREITIEAARAASDRSADIRDFCEAAS